jgi:hypothetical protein
METNETRLRQSVEALCMTYGFIAVSHTLDSIKVGIDVTLGAFGFAAINPSYGGPVQSAQRESKPIRAVESKEKSTKEAKAAKAAKPAAPATGKRTRNISDEARERIAEAQKRRWAKYRKDAKAGKEAPARKPRAAKSAATPVAEAPPAAQAPEPIDGIVAPPQDDAFTREFDALVSGTALDTTPQQ